MGFELLVLGFELLVFGFEASFFFDVSITLVKVVTVGIAANNIQPLVKMVMQTKIKQHIKLKRFFIFF